MLKKLFVAMLAFVTMFGTVVQPTPVHAADNQKRVVLSIDAGRKYFSAHDIETIIIDASNKGYTDIQLILGNDGLRFYLDDMSVTVGDQTYDSDAVKAGMKEGNDTYYADPNGDALTEAEMDRIIEKARKYNIGIIPVINTPGHMDAILVGMESLGMTDVRFSYNGKTSERTVNLLNDDAIEFCKQLVKKYATYFAEKGVTDIFNLGCDEYANDVFSVPGWQELQNLGHYEKFINYVNDLCAIVKEVGLRPMSFNDGIYYNSRDTYGEFDKDLIISYWTAGWWGFYVAKPEYFVEKGHDILNTNDAWYWVLGNIDDGGYQYNNTVKNIEKTDFNQVTGASGAIDTIGSMQCVWCDDPSKELDLERIFSLTELFTEKNVDNVRTLADYSGLWETLDKLPTETENYTEESLAALEAAVGAIVYNLEIEKQAEVDAMAKAIEDAIAGLTLKTADYSKVVEALKEVEALNKEDYTNFEVVEEAVKAVVEGLDITKQAEVDAMAKAITDAIEKLQKVEKPAPTPTPTPTPTPDTGDTTSVMAYGMMGLAAMMAGIALMKKKEQF